MSNLILNKWVDLLAALRTKNNPSMHRLSRQLDITYSHLVSLVTEFEKLNWIKSVKKGRVREITLTGKGEEMQKSIMPILLELKRRSR